MIRDLAYGVKSFKDQGLFHGDIQPANIYVLDNKSLKLIDVAFLNDEKSGFIRKYNEVNYFSPLSPQCMSGLVLGPESTVYSKELSDIWGIGK